MTEARFWCRGRVRLLNFVWHGLRCIVPLEHALTCDYCINAVMRKPTFDISSSLPSGFSRRHPHATQRYHKDFIRKRSTYVCRRSVCQSMRQADDSLDALVLCTLTRPIFRPTDTLFFLK